jgi:hypothetical protein
MIHSFFVEVEEFGHTTEGVWVEQIPLHFAVDGVVW